MNTGLYPVFLLPSRGDRPVQVRSSLAGPAVPSHTIDARRTCGGGGRRSHDTFNEKPEERSSYTWAEMKNYRYAYNIVATSLLM